jgi:hypothetical protein
MPIAASLLALQSLIANAFNLGRAASPSNKASAITNAIASIAPTGLFPAGPVLIPLPAVGAAATQTILTQAFSLNRAAYPDAVAKMCAIGIAALCPIVPPIGLVILEIQLSQAFSLDRSANVQTVGMVFAQAVINYYLSSGVI